VSHVWGMPRFMLVKDKAADPYEQPFVMRGL